METIERGHGDRVVLVHGDLFDGPATWAAQEPLSVSYRLVVVNRRGFGNSPDADGEDFEVDARDVVGVLSAGPAHLAGHSYGGVVALLAAAQAPELVRSLVVFEPPAFALVRERTDVQRFIADVETILAADPDPETFVRQFITAVGGDPSRLPTPLPPPMLRAARVQMHGRWPWHARIPIGDLAATAYPKVVVSGGHSALFDSVCDVLEARLSARREVIPGAGHSIPTLGRPVNESLSAFWASVAA